MIARRMLMAAITALALAAAPARAASPITVTDAWSRATIPGMTEGVVYLTLHNAGPADALLRAATPVAGQASLHVSRDVNGVMTMRAVPQFALPQNASVALAPDGYHIMLSGITKPLVAPASFPLTLYFAHAAPLTVAVTVRPLGAAAPMPSMPGMK